MEKITITRIGQEKVIEYTNKKTGKPDSFKKVGVQTNEYGERWYNIAFRGEVPVKVGQSYEGEITERPYTNKAGEEKIDYEFKLPREGKGGMSEADKTRMTVLENKITSQELRLNKLLRLLVEKDILEMPEPEKPTVPGTTVEYPESTGATAFDDDPANDPDFDPFGGMSA